MKPYYDHEGITIYHGDCRDILPQIGIFDFVLTDPPYYGREDLFSTESIPFVMDYLLRQDVPAFIFWPCMGDIPNNPDAVHIWHKSIPIHPNSQTGNVAGHHYERILSYGNGKKCLVFRVAAIMPNFAPCKKEFTIHPTQKPLRLIKELLGISKGNTILDPFMGSGTTLVAAKSLNKKAVGIEIEEKYCEIAAKRLAQSVFDFG